MRSGRIVAAGGFAVLVLLAGFAFWRASVALRDASAGVAAGARIDFTTRPIDRRALPDFDLVGAPAIFSDAAVFQGKLYVCGPAGLYVHEAGGTLVARYRAGLELPPAPLVAMTTGVAAESAETELFIATAGEGLYAFDGRRFRHIRPRDPSLRKLTAVLALPTGRILLGTEKRGVLAYDGRSLDWFHAALKDVPVTELVGGEADLWAGTRDRGLLHWQAGRLDRFAESDGLPDQHVLSLAVGRDAVYAGTALGIAEFRGGRYARTVAEGTFAKSLLADDDGLIVGTLDEGVVAVGRRRPLPPCGGCRAIQRIFNADGSLYALAEDGLYAAEAGAWRKRAAGEQALLADRNISALALDGAGRLWVGYFDRGLEVVDAGGSRSTHIENEHVFCVNRIATDARTGNTAVATANGLVMFDAAAAERQVIGRAEGLIANHATDVIFRPDGMAVATPAGITFFDGSGAHSLYAFHGLVNNHVYALAAAGDRLLAGTLGGLSILDGGMVRASFTVANSGLKHNWITAITAVDDGWFVGTYGAGVARLDAGGRWEQFSELKAPAIVNPNAMLASGGRVYAGLLDGGLAVFNRASGRWITLADGLPSLNVTALAAGGGMLYIGTDNGLVRVREEALRLP